MPGLCSFNLTFSTDCSIRTKEWCAADSHTQYTQLAHFAIRSSIPPFKTVNHIYTKQLATARRRETIDCMILRLEIDRLGSFWSMINVFLNSGRPLLRDNRRRHAVSVTNFVDNDVSTTRLLKLSEHHQSPFGYGPSLFTACYGVFMFVFVCVVRTRLPARSLFTFSSLNISFELTLSCCYSSSDRQNAIHDRSKEYGDRQSGVWEILLERHIHTECISSLCVFRSIKFIRLSAHTKHELELF